MPVDVLHHDDRVIDDQANGTAGTYNLNNLSIGAKDFRFFGLANPKSWDDASCKYCLPPAGVKADERIVVTGAQQLLSEELKSANGPE